MPYLVNSTGRIVPVNEEEEAKWLLQPGFRKLTEEEEKRIVSDRVTLAKTVNERREPTKEGVYMVTVSQGGKDGYGIASSQIIKELTNLGVTIQTHNTGQKIALLFHNPYSINRIEAPYKIIYTMFESDKIPDDWAEYLEVADVVLVPSKWCQAVFAKAGIKAQVVPLVFDASTFTYKPRVAKRENNKDFILSSL
jgi:hypothetical protein